MFELEYPRRVLFFDEFPQSKNGRKVSFTVFDGELNVIVLLPFLSELKYDWSL